MASQTEYYNKLKPQADEQYAKTSAANTTTAEKLIADTNAAYDPAINNAKSQAVASKSEVNKSWQDNINTNAIQQAVNEKLLKEKMSSAGMTDSGLNRTQMTAVALQKGNNDYKAGQAKSESNLKIEQSLNNYLSGIDTTKSQAKATAYANLSEKNQAVYNSIYNALSDNATSLANADTAAEAAVDKARIEAETASNKAIAAATAAAEKEAKATYKSAYNEAYNKKTSASDEDTGKQAAYDYINGLHMNGMLDYEQSMKLAASLGIDPTDYAYELTDAPAGQYGPWFKIRE